GSEIGIAATGEFTVGSSQAIELPENTGSVARTSSYLPAPRTGFHANAGVRGKLVVPLGKPGRNAWSAPGAARSARPTCAGVRTAALAPPASASTARARAAVRTTGIPLRFAAATQAPASCG